jgi:hypothetical protein
VLRNRNKSPAKSGDTTTEPETKLGSSAYK